MSFSYTCLQISLYIQKCHLGTLWIQQLAIDFYYLALCLTPSFVETVLFFCKLDQTYWGDVSHCGKQSTLALWLSSKLWACGQKPLALIYFISVIRAPQRAVLHFPVVKTPSFISAVCASSLTRPPFTRAGSSVCTVELCVMNEIRLMCQAWDAWKSAWITLCVATVISMLHRFYRLHVYIH